MPPQQNTPTPPFNTPPVSPFVTPPPRRKKWPFIVVGGVLILLAVAAFFTLMQPGIFILGDKKATTTPANISTTSIMNTDSSAPLILPYADLKINGSDGPVDVTDKQAITLTWTSEGTEACYVEGSMRKKETSVRSDMPTAGTVQAYAYINEPLEGKVQIRLYCPNTKSPGVSIDYMQLKASGWQNYTNAEDGYSLQYPANFKRDGDFFLPKEGGGVSVHIKAAENDYCYIELCEKFTPAKETVTLNGIMWDYLGQTIYSEGAGIPHESYRTKHGNMTFYAQSTSKELVESVLNTFEFIK